MSLPIEPSTSNIPLAPLDAEGKALSVGSSVRILSVSSCAKGLPTEDQERLSALVGEVRSVVEIDSFGFVWFPFVEEELGPDFCLFPAEVSLAPV
jgi:hypothetical protein